MGYHIGFGCPNGARHNRRSGAIAMESHNSKGPYIYRPEPTMAGTTAADGSARSDGRPTRRIAVAWAAVPRIEASADEQSQAVIDEHANRIETEVATIVCACARVYTCLYTRPRTGYGHACARVYAQLSHMSAHMPIHMPIHMSTHTSIHLSVRMSTPMPNCMCTG